MKILSFDTCFLKTYVTLSEDNNIIISKSIDTTDENYHSVYLIPNIVEILNTQNLKIQNLDAIGVNIGPGSFTGIRISATIARVFAQSANLKLVGVPSLQILSKINTLANNTTVILDARKNKVYYAKYNSEHKAITEPELIEKESIENIIDRESYIITDNNTSEYLNSLNINAVKFEEHQEHLGEYLAELTFEILKSNKNNDFHFAHLKPMYIQPPSITLKKGKNVL